MPFEFPSISNPLETLDLTVNALQAKVLFDVGKAHLATTTFKAPLPLLFGINAYQSCRTAYKLFCNNPNYFSQEWNNDALF